MCSRISPLYDMIATVTCPDCKHVKKHKLNLYSVLDNPDYHFPRFHEPGRIHTEECEEEMERHYRRKRKAQQQKWNSGYADTDSEESSDDGYDCHCPFPVSCEKCGREIKVEGENQVETKRLYWRCWACNHINEYCGYEICYKTGVVTPGCEVDHCWECEYPRGSESSDYFWCERGSWKPLSQAE